MKPEDLLDQARAANTRAETSIWDLAQALTQVEETGAWKIGYESFMQFCIEDLGRTKGFVSKLLTAAKYKTNYLAPEEAVASAEKLYLAIQAFPDKDPSYVVTAANTLTKHELEESNRERRSGEHDHTPKNDERYAVCHCGKMYRV